MNEPKMLEIKRPDKQPLEVGDKVTARIDGGELEEIELNGKIPRQVNFPPGQRATYHLLETSLGGKGYDRNGHRQTRA
jgi:hypothetical protein